MIQFLLSALLATSAGASGVSNPNALTAQYLAATPSICSSGQAAQGVTAYGNATGCQSVPTISPSSVTLQGNTFNGALQLMQTTPSGAMPAISGAFLRFSSTSYSTSGSTGVFVSTAGADRFVMSVNFNQSTNNTTMAVFFSTTVGGCTPDSKANDYVYFGQGYNTSGTASSDFSTTGSSVPIMPGTITAGTSNSSLLICQFSNGSVTSGAPLIPGWCDVENNNAAFHQWFYYNQNNGSGTKFPITCIGIEVGAATNAGTIQLYTYQP